MIKYDFLIINSVEKIEKRRDRTDFNSEIVSVYVQIIAGTFGATDKLTNETECTQCTGGHYCDIAGLSAPAGGCNSGHYCVSGILTLHILT